MRLKLSSLSPSCVTYLSLVVLIICAIGQVKPLARQQDSAASIFTTNLQHNHQATTSNTNNNNRLLPSKNQCTGRIFRPIGCELNYNCSYQLAWHFNSTTDTIAFSVTLDSREKWAAVGFAQERSLKNVDAIFGWTEGNTSYVMMDAYLPTWTEPVPDYIQSIANVRVKHVSRQGAEYKFTRKRNTQDPKSDILFSDENCPYLIYPYQGGAVDLKRRAVLTSAEQLPEISQERVCIRSCNYVPPIAAANPVHPPAEIIEPPVSPQPSSTARPPTAPNQRPTRPPFKAPRTTSTSTTTTTTTPPPSSTTTSTTTTTPEPTTTTTTSTTTTTTTQPPVTTTTPAPTTTTTSSTTTIITTTSTTTTPRPSSTTSSSTTTTTAPVATSSTVATGRNANVQQANNSQKPQLIAEESAPQATADQQQQQQQWCVGRWSHPPNCRFQSSVAADLSSYLDQPIDSSVNIRPLPLELSDCTYYAQWQYLEQSDSVEFIIQTKTRNKWTGIGFSNSTRMANSDAIVGLIEELSGRHFIMDTWLKDHVMPEIDQNQNTEQTSGKRENGTTTVRFRRKRLTGDQYDFQFSDSSCAYFFFPTQGGSFNAISKRLHKHEMVPFVSKQRICIRKCQAPKVPPIVTTTTTTSTSASSTQSPTSVSPNLFLLTSSSSQNPVLTQFSNQQQPPTASDPPPAPEKNLDSQSNNHLSPSNDLSAELDSASVTSSVFASTSGAGVDKNGSNNLLATATTTTTAAGAAGAGSAGVFNKLAFLAEPSLRWLAAIGCVATILAVIVFQACFTVYKNKQAYKQNLYRQSAFKQNNYLQGAYLTPDTHNLASHHHNGVQVEVDEEDEEQEDEVEPDDEDEVDADEVDEEDVDEVDEEELEEEEDLDEDEEYMEDYAQHHHHHQQQQHRHHLPRPAVGYPSHHRGAAATAANHLPGYYPSHPKHHHHNNAAAYYPQPHSKHHNHHHSSSAASPHNHHLHHHQMMPPSNYHPSQQQQQQQRAQQQHYRSAGGHHHHAPPPQAAAMQHQMHATGNLHHGALRASHHSHSSGAANIGQHQHKLRSPDSYFLPSQRRYNK